ncbi:TetR family transcriptional regulator [Actinomycetes bacterium KLBMP 9759]
MTENADAVALTRAERRRRSEGLIVDAARSLFADQGYERTTIRAVAERAGVDAALVMQHFGSKEALFAAVARWGVPMDDLGRASRDDVPHAALRHVLDVFEDESQRSGAEALLRSSLTHTGAGDVMREQVIGEPLARLGDTIGGPDAALRAALLNACTIGLTISRYLLRIPALADADPADLERVLEPALRALVDPD